MVRGCRQSVPTETAAPYWSAVTTVTGDGEGPAFLDLSSDGYDADPHGAHRAARRRAWYAETPMGRMALRHAEVSALLRDRRLAELGGRALAMVGITDGPLWDWWTTMLFSQDGESHQRLRRLVSTAFTPRSVEQSRPALRAVAERLLAPLAPGAEVELVSAFCAPFAASVIGELLGIDPADHGRFFAASDDLALAFTGQLATERDRIEAGLSALCDYAADLVTDRRRRPGDDLLSRLVAAEDAGERLTAGELVMLVTILIFGGLDTTRCQLACAAATFCERPDQWRLLAERPDLAGRAAEEILRFEPAGAGAPRVAVCDFEFGGVAFAGGDIVLPSTMAANRDPDAFIEPDRFDVTAQRGTGQLTFGGGAHYCLGAALARAELVEVLSLLPRRMPDLRLAGEPRWRRLATIRGPEHLPVVFG